MTQDIALNLDDFLPGPSLILRNAFRLAQMPVDSSERKLNKRQQMQETAEKMGMPIPAGPSPIFIDSELQDPDLLKEALHRMKDPINRIFDELFWFWPHNFGKSETDEGLRLLEKDNIEEAFAYWKKKEQYTENFVSTHNLALLCQFLALRIDNRLISDKISLDDNKGLFGIGGNKEEKRSRLYWKESLSRWQLLSKQEGFWSFLKGRIRSINDPRLPVESADWFRNNIVSILLSINAGLVIRAAENNLHDHIRRQKEILKDYSFVQNDIDTILETLTRKYRHAVQQLCKNAEKDAQSDPLHGDVPARQVATQASPLLHLLSNIYPDGDKTIDTLHDEVAETILHCQVAYGKKTENWVVSAELLKIAEPFARGETARSRITDNIKVVQELKDQGSIWCHEGYFELPTPCIDLLEKARTYEDTGQYNEAIDMLREALLGYVELPFSQELRKHLRHCLAYCLKSKAVVAFNRGIAEYNANAHKMLASSVQCDGGLYNGYGICASCRGTFTGSYVNRKIQNYTFPFCTSCSSQIDRKFKELEVKLNAIKKESLDLMVLANEFDSQCKAVVRNLKTIRDAARESGISEPNPNEMKLKLNLSEAGDLISQLEKASDSSVASIFDCLLKMISRQCASYQVNTVSKLLAAVTVDASKVARLTPYLMKDDLILTKFIEFAFVNKANNEMILTGICSIGNPTFKFNFMDKISLILVDYEKFLKPIIQSVIKDIEKLTGNSAPDEGILSKDTLALMERLAKHSPSGKNACLNRIFELLFKEGSTTRIAKSVFAIRNESQLTDSLFKFISQNIDQLPQERMLDIYTSIYRATYGDSGTSLSKLLMKHLLEVKDKIRSEDLVKFCLLLLGNENGVFDSAFDLLKNNPKLGMHNILLASGTKNPRQSERLSQLISLLIKQPDSDSVDPSLMVRSLLAASTPELSNELYRLMTKFIPDYKTMLRKKSFIRDLKFLAQNATGTQQATAKRMLEEERSRGWKGRFNVWQWKPSVKYEISAGENIWWSQEAEFIKA